MRLGMKILAYLVVALILMGLGYYFIFSSKNSNTGTVGEPPIKSIYGY